MKSDGEIKKKRKIEVDKQDMTFGNTGKCNRISEISKLAKVKKDLFLCT